MFALVHEPPQHARRRTAVLLLPPFGWDNDNSYRARRNWAGVLAGAGFFTLRIDLPGTENSGGCAEDEGALADWVTAAAESAGWLRAHSGAERVVAIGIGLSGLIAYEVARAGGPIDDLVLWGTRATGRDHLRELRAYAAVAGGEQAGAGPSGAGTPGAGPSGAGAPDGMSVAGHRLGAALLAGLAQIDLTALGPEAAPQRRVLLVGRDGLGPDPRLVAALEAAGADVSLAAGADHHRLIAPPEYALAPEETVATVLDWLRAAEPVAPDSSRGHAAWRVPQASMTAEFDHAGTRIRETIAAVRFGESTLFGVIAEPLSPAPGSPRCLLLANTLAFRHTGPGRVQVQAARQAAATGHSSARFDLPGIGDSDGPAFDIRSRSAQDQALAARALCALATELAARGVSEQFLASGVCSGATLALLAARRERRIVAVVALNPPALGGGEAPRRATRQGALAHAARAGGRGAASDPSEAGSRRSAPGRRHAAVPRLHAAVSRLRARLAEVDAFWRLAHWPEARAAAADLRELAQLNASVVIALSNGEPIARMLGFRGPSTALVRSPNVSVVELGEGDHFLRSPRAKQLALELIADTLAQDRGPAAQTAREAQTAQEAQAPPPRVGAAAGPAVFGDG